MHAPLQSSCCSHRACWVLLGAAPLPDFQVVPEGDHLIVGHLSLECAEADMPAVLARLKAARVPFRKNVRWAAAATRGLARRAAGRTALLCTGCGGARSPTLPRPLPARPRPRPHSVPTRAEDGIVTQYFLRDPDGYYVELCNCDILTDFCLCAAAAGRQGWRGASPSARACCGCITPRRAAPPTLPRPACCTHARLLCPSLCRRCREEGRDVAYNESSLDVGLPEVLRLGAVAKVRWPLCAPARLPSPPC